MNEDDVLEEEDIIELEEIEAEKRHNEGLRWPR
jgi:hypothetical protein